MAMPSLSVALHVQCSHWGAFLQRSTFYAGAAILLATLNVHSSRCNAYLQPRSMQAQHLCVLIVWMLAHCCCYVMHESHLLLMNVKIVICFPQECRPL